MKPIERRYMKSVSCAPIPGPPDGPAAPSRLQRLRGIDGPEHAASGSLGRQYTPIAREKVRTPRLMTRRERKFMPEAWAFSFLKTNQKESARVRHKNLRRNASLGTSPHALPRTTLHENIQRFAIPPGGNLEPSAIGQGVCLGCASHYGLLFSLRPLRPLRENFLTARSRFAQRPPRT